MSLLIILIGLTFSFVQVQGCIRHQLPCVSPNCIEKEQAHFTVEEGNTVIMYPSAPLCDFKTNCTVEYFDWYRGEDYLFHGYWNWEKLLKQSKNRKKSTTLKVTYSTERVSANSRYAIRNLGLQINDAKRSDSGLYVFEGKYYERLNYDTVGPQKTLIFIADLAVKHGADDPYITVKGCVCEGRNVTLECEIADASQTTTLVWLHDGVIQRQAVQKKYRHVFQASSLTIGPLVAGDDKEFECRSYTSHNKLPGLRKVLVKPQYAPKWQESARHRVNAHIGASVTLWCNVHAYPAPFKFRWYFKRKRVTPERNQRVKFRRNRQKMIIQNITSEDFGTYNCLSENSRGKSRFSLRLLHYRRKTRTKKNPNSNLKASTRHENAVLDQQ